MGKIDEFSGAIFGTNCPFAEEQKSKPIAACFLWGGAYRLLKQMAITYGLRGVFVIQYLLLLFFQPLGLMYLGYQ